MNALMLFLIALCFISLATMSGGDYQHNKPLYRPTTGADTAVFRPLPVRNGPPDPMAYLLNTNAHEYRQKNTSAK